MRETDLVGPRWSMKYCCAWEAVLSGYGHVQKPSGLVSTADSDMIPTRGGAMVGVWAGSDLMDWVVPGNVCDSQGAY